MSYLWIKALHVISVIAWMAGMFYLPRLFAYHADVKPGTEMSETFKVMERRLLRIIMNPAMILTFVFGAVLLLQNPDLLHQPYMHAKLGLVFLMAGLHGYLAKCRKVFAIDANMRSSKFYRMLNEVPTILMFGIVILVIVKPEF